MTRGIERVLVVHNAYQLHGGEDVVVEAETALLRQHGLNVRSYLRSNDELKDIGRFEAAFDTFWSRRTAQEVDALIEEFRPDILHVHNTFMRVSPSVYSVAQRHRVPIVQTLHNFRMLCPQGMLMRNHAVCEDCVGKLPWRGVVHRCYRGSMPQSAISAAMLTVHGRTLRRDITRYIALNAFAKEMMVRGGFPRDRIDIKSNFVKDPGPPPAPSTRQGLLFVGRLSPEKGVATLCEASKLLPPGMVIDVIGEGPLADQLRGLPNIRQHGWVAPPEVIRRMQQSRLLIVPSVWHEGGPQTVLEAYACGLPVLASRLGPLAVAVRDGVTGYLFEPGSSHDLARRLQELVNDAPLLADMGEQARAQYERVYTPERNHVQLMAIYEAARAQASL